jgi:predicted Rossmann fold flavoprotein
VAEQHVDVVILGAGAAGLYAAIHAGRRGRRVLLLDHAEKAGKKILISGGGRCNFTNLQTEPKRFLSENPHFAISALKRHGPPAFLAMVERHGIAWHEKKLGQLFCDHSANEIVAMLLNEAADAQVSLRLECRIRQILSAEGSFTVETNQETWSAAALVVATGGLSIPKMGATGLAFEIAAQFGVPVVPPRPGLVPLTFTAADLAKLADLSGIALEATVTCNEGRFREALLLTHRGLSGPSILQVSSYWRPGDPVLIDLSPDEPMIDRLKGLKQSRPKAELKTILAEILPRRFAERLVETELEGLAVQSRPMAQMPDRELTALAAFLHRWTLLPQGTEGWRTAEVMAGGISTAALSSRTMEVKAVPGLYFIGEAVDVTGWLGGYNFQWSWSSGHACGLAV